MILQGFVGHLHTSQPPAAQPEIFRSHGIESGEATAIRELTMGQRWSLD